MVSQSPRRLAHIIQPYPRVNLEMIYTTLPYLRLRTQVSSSQGHSVLLHHLDSYLHDGGAHKYEVGLGVKRPP